METVGEENPMVLWNLTDSQKRIIKAVIEGITLSGEELGEREEYSTAKWTEVILTAICDKLPSGNYRYCCCSSAKKRAFGEWLFDLTYYEEDASRHLKRLLLVLESEWSASPYEIKYDFEKLLIAKCCVKVMITESPKAIEVVKDGVTEFSTDSCNEVYMLANHEGKGKFLFTLFDGKRQEDLSQDIIQELFK